MSQRTTPKYSHPRIRKGLSRYVLEHDTLRWYPTSAIRDDLRPYRSIDIQLKPAPELNGEAFRFVAVLSTAARARYQFFNDWYYWRSYVQDHERTEPPCPLRNSDLGLVVPGDWKTSVFDYDDSYLSDALSHHVGALTGQQIDAKRTEPPEPDKSPMPDLDKGTVIKRPDEEASEAVEPSIKDRSDYSDAQLIRDLRIAALNRVHYDEPGEWRDEDLQRVRELVDEGRYTKTLRALNDESG